MLGYTLINSILEPRYVDILFVTYPFFKRFYTGNRDNSEMIAKLYNEKNNKLLAKNILEQLQQQVNANERNGLKTTPRDDK